MADDPVRITVYPNRPLRVEGHILLQDADGKQFDLGGKTAFGLCRCGLSEHRPYCDGSHAKHAWQSVNNPGNLTGK